VGYAEVLRATFPGLDPVVDDLFLLEAHEVAELPLRVPGPELAAVLHTNPSLRLFLCRRHPPVAGILDELLATHGPVPEAELSRCVDAVLWEVADWIVYERAPAYYDQQVTIPWDVTAVADVVDLAGARVIDAGAGTGRVALSVAPLASEVFAVEPVAALRRYLRKKATQHGLTNVYVLDGRLDDVPLPTGTADVLVTCHSVGWNLPAELREIDRLVRPGGTAVHAFAAMGGQPHGGPVIDALTANGYVHTTHSSSRGLLHCYARQMIGQPRGAVGESATP
jgi:SAM-dependent methyltransferase